MWNSLWLRHGRKTEGMNYITILLPYTVMHLLWERENAKIKISEVPLRVCKISRVKATCVSSEQLHFPAMTQLPDF